MENLNRFCQSCTEEVNSSLQFMILSCGDSICWNCLQLLRDKDFKCLTCLTVIDTNKSYSASKNYSLQPLGVSSSALPDLAVNYICATCNGKMVSPKIHSQVNPLHVVVPTTSASIPQVKEQNLPLKAIEEELNTRVASATLVQNKDKTILRSFIRDIDLNILKSNFTLEDLKNNTNLALKLLSFNQSVKKAKEHVLNQKTLSNNLNNFDFGSVKEKIPVYVKYNVNKAKPTTQAILDQTGNLVDENNIMILPAESLMGRRFFLSGSHLLIYREDYTEIALLAFLKKGSLEEYSYEIIHSYDLSSLTDKPLVSVRITGLLVFFFYSDSALVYNLDTQTVHPLAGFCSLTEGTQIVLISIDKGPILIIIGDFTNIWIVNTDYSTYRANNYQIRGKVFHYNTDLTDYTVIYKENNAILVTKSSISQKIVYSLGYDSEKINVREIEPAAEFQGGNEVAAFKDSQMILGAIKGRAAFL